MTLAFNILLKSTDNSDYIVSVSPDGEVYFFTKGIYGGYISKSDMAEQANFFLVSIEREEMKKVKPEELLSGEPKYREIKEAVISKVKYKLIKVEADIVDKDKYKLIKKIKPRNEQYEAEAYLVELYLGQRKFDNMDEEKAEVLKAKYAAMLKLPFYMVVKSGRKAKWDEFYLRLKVVTKAPQITPQAPQVIAAQTQEDPQINAPEVGSEEDLVPVQPQQPTPQPIPIEETREESEETERERSKLIPLFVVDFKLPSFQLSRISHTSSVNDVLLETMNRYYVDLGYKLESIRVTFYNRIQRSFYNTVLGWVSPSEEDAKAIMEARDEAVKALETVIVDIKNEANNMLSSNDPKKKEIGLALSNVVRKLEERKQQLISVRVFKIYMEPSDALYVATNVVKDIGNAVETLRKEAEEKKSAYRSRRVRVLEGILQKWQKLIKDLEAYEKAKTAVPLVQ